VYVKSLRLVGFKSFADRTRLEFEPGVTVIVGPNGSGKSNLVDAIAWVMGTQSTRSLRTHTMEDVIFAGTAVRPAFGRAEVTLVLDNTMRTLPLDLDEVAITRRLHRDGSSDYEINGVDCRLLDIQELLSDGGIGRQQHLIVGQGRIDDLLNAKPEDHRAVIEEAAGVLKHRLRKERSVRRLERTDADVLRLKDILGELQRQIRPLQRQARSADRHAELLRGVRELRLFIGGEALRTVTGRLSELEEQRARWTVQLEAAAAERSALDGRIPDLAADAGSLGRALDRDTTAAALLETTAERLRRISQVAHERRRSAQARLEGAGERRRDLEAEAVQLGTELAESSASESQAKSTAERAERVFRDLEDEARSLADQDTLPVEGALAVLRGDLRSLEAAVDRDMREVDDVERRLDVLAARVTEETAEIDELQTAIRMTDGETEAIQSTYERCRAERERLQGQWERAESTLSDARLALAAAEARAKALEEATTVDEETRNRLLDHRGVRGALTSILAVPDELAKAVDTALGSWAGAFVAGSRADVHAAAADLKHDGVGGVSLVSGASDDVPARSAAQALGVVALVDALGADVDMRVAAALLGDVVIVEGWSAAWEVVSRHPSLRAVTPEGDLVDATGMHISGTDDATPAMIESALVALEEVEVESARASSLVTSAKRTFDDARRSEREALEALEALEAKLSGMSEALAMRERGRSSTEGEMERLEERKADVLDGIAEKKARIERLNERVTHLEGEEAERQRAWEELADRRREVEGRRAGAARERSEAAEALGAVMERRRMLEGRLRTVRGEIQSMTDRPVDPALVMKLQLVEDHSVKASEIVAAHLATLRERQRTIRHEAGEAGGRLAEARTRLEELRNAVDIAKEQSAAVAIEQAELSARKESVAEGLRRDADASEEEALAAPRPELDEDPRYALASREAELRRLGPVNPLAAQEYRDLKERHDFLSVQLADLESSRAELRTVITALDERIAEEFLAAFREVAGYYEEYFGLLFPGGRGQLRLVDGDEPLTSGVEIEAKPLGKKVGRLTLLSGGERSLAALAFLFSVFRARPGPFYILDEVEAALDDANLRRFLRLVSRFRERAQLLIVTHQQQTMEAADILYGVTLEAGGSSQVLSRRVTLMA
jgi:chromosome segregation protein